jgi:hypothetical protein
LRNLIEQQGLRALAHFGQFAVQQQVRSNQPANPGRVTGGPSDTAVDDFARAFAAAPVQLDATYTTSKRSACDDGAACLHCRRRGTGLRFGHVSPREACTSQVPRPR